jgi:DNA-binding NarL/FixJ family response regulator
MLHAKCPSAADLLLATDVPTTMCSLSPRQREVTALIGLGLTNQEIAERLVLTPGTVVNHVENMLHRTGARNRAQAAVWFVLHELRCRHCPSAWSG